MTTLDPREAHNQMAQAVTSAFSSVFPVKGLKTTLHLKNVVVGEPPDAEDVEAQREVKVMGKTWSAPVHGVMELRDNTTDQVISSQKVRLMDIPAMTKRMSYIFNGQEHQVANQWQLKAGVYARRQTNGELEARFNVVNRAAFKMKLQPETGTFMIEYKKANLPAYPLLKAMDVSDEDMERMWGKQLFETNRDVKRQSGTLAQFYRTSTNGKEPPASHADLAKHLQQVMKESVVRPEVVEHTLGHKTSFVDGTLLLRAGKKLIDVQNGQPEDNRDSLVFKTLRGPDDFLKDQIAQSARSMVGKIQRGLNRGDTTDIRQSVRPGMFNESVRKMFQSSLVNPAKQINPLDMIGTAMQTTIMGPGGIKSDIQVTDAAKMIDSSQFGMIDPITTPEGSQTGISLRLPIGVKRIGDQPHTPVWDIKQKKTVYVNPATFMNKNVVLADQVRFTQHGPQPLSKEVKMLGANNEPEVRDFGEADYVLKHPSQVYGITVNLVPFLQNNSGGRVSMASRHMEQAISLVERDKPLVQVKTPGDTNIPTFEHMVGRQSAHVAPVSGKVTKITPAAMFLQDAKGKEHKLALYNHYPVNDSKSLLHSTPLVKVGDQVAAGSVVADNNYTRDGVLALGKNLRTAYMSYHGLNFEDGIVVTESAAKKLSSAHLHKQTLTIPEINSKLEFNVAKFKNAHPLLYTKDQYKHIDDATGIARIGSKVKPGDPLVVALQPYQVKDRVGLGALRKSLTNQLIDKSLKWEGEVEGEVVSVHHNADGVHVHVKTVEPLKVGDKLCFDEETEVLTSKGWKPVYFVTLNDKVCCLQEDGSFTYQKPSKLHVYPQGGRMYRLESQQLDMFVTAQHKLYVQPRGKESFELLPAEQVFGKRVSHKKNGVWAGSSPEGMDFPEHQAGVPGGKGHRILPSYRMPVRTFLFLLGAYLSEGSVYQDGLSISQTKPEGRRAFEEMVESVGLHVHPCEERFLVYGVQLRDYFRQFGHAHEKYIPEEVFSWAREDLEVLFHWLMWGDGHTETLPISYTTTSKRLADDVQRLCLHIGKAANVQWSDPPPLEKDGKTYPRRRVYSVRIINTKLTPTVNHGHVKKQNVQTEEIVDNFMGPVYCVTVPGHVLYVRRNGKPCWSGNSHRHGGKGIVTTLLPDHEAPHDKNGKPVDILFQPGGLGGRMNIGQVLEAMGGKIAEKTGKPYIVENFDPNIKDQTAHMKAELQKHGLSDTEELIDPKTKLSYGQVMTGPLHFLKLVHQMDKKESMRAGMGLPQLQSGEKYDPTTLQPTSGGGTGGQSWGQLGMYALLAHGAKGLLRESMTFKSEGDDPETNEAKRWKSQHNDVWRAIQTGQPIPPPKPTFAFHRFTELVKAAGINLEKKGDGFYLSPLTDKHILSMSKGEIVDPVSVVHAKRDKDTGEFKPVKGGLFDPQIMGGHGGNNWGHVRLAEPIPNPVFEEPIKKILGITETVYQKLLKGESAVDPHTHKIVEGGKGLTGGHAFKHLLGRINVSKELAETKAQLQGAKADKVNPLYKKARYLGALEQLKMKPDEAYVLNHLPILPTKLRPLSGLDDGALHYEGINGLYAKFGQLNKTLASPANKLLPDSYLAPFRADLYDSVAALFGTGTLPEGAKDKGVLHMIAGTQPKRGLFQQGLLSRRQDMSARATIIPEPKLTLDEIGVPKEMALTIFRPQMVRQLVVQGSAKDELTAQGMLAQAHKGKADPAVESALKNLMANEVVVAKRDPALWKYSVQAFKPKLVSGKAIRIHPLVTGGFNADFDGDQMSLQVPITQEAKKDALKMFPSANIFSESTGDVAFVPSMESLLGAHRLSLVGKATAHVFSSEKDVMQGLSSGKLHINDQIKFGKHTTTPGRILLASAVPDTLRDKVLTDFTMELNKKGLAGLFGEVGKKHPQQFVAFADKMKDLGYDASTGIIRTHLHPEGRVAIGAHSFKLDDFLADKATRDPIVAQADVEANQVKQKKGLSKPEMDRQVAEVYLRADQAIQKTHQASGRWTGNNLKAMTDAGMKPSKDQYKQMTLAPMVMTDATGRMIPLPITRSYGEGLDLMGYTIQQSGARSGTVKKVQEVQEPGYMTKLLQNTAMDKIIDKHDCGTHKGLAVSVLDYDVTDRHLVSPLKLPGLDLPAGQLLTKDVVDKIRKIDPKAALHVRSALHCHSEKGVCQKCYGLDANGKHPELGTNIGVLSAHTLGERAVQLTLKEFHCLHEHSIVLVKQGERVFHSTLSSLFMGATPSINQPSGHEERIAQDLWVWSVEGWVKVRNVSRHLQEPGTQMVMARTRSGYGLISQDNHPHMLAINHAVCSTCGTYPKRSNKGKQHYCRKCGRTWQGAIPGPTEFSMTMPSDIEDKSHTALVSGSVSATPQNPPLQSGWLAGMYCAEGYIHAQNKDGQPYVVGFGIGQKQGTPVYTKLGAELRGEFPAARMGAQDRAYQVYGRERGLVFERIFGRYSRNVGLPDGWSGFPVSWLSDFVAGVFDGDGTLVTTKDSKGTIGRIDTTSYLLAQQTHHILRSLGVQSRVLVTPWREKSLHQGYAVTFPITEAAKKLLSASMKLRKVKASATSKEERFADVVDYVRPVRFGAPPWVYDLETETGTLFINSVWTHNSGGVAKAGGGAMGAFQRLEQLTYLPDKISNAAVHANVAGTVEKIEPTATGTHVWIAGKQHFVGKDNTGNSLHLPQQSALQKNAWKGVHVGMEVKPGDLLSDPMRTNMNPHRLFEATKSMDRVQEAMATEMHKLYADEGVRKRAVEVVVRSMGDLTEIEHPGGNDHLLRGQTYSRSAVDTLNRELKAAGKDTIRHKPVLRGVTLIPLQHTEDWMARLNHQKLRDTMMEGAGQNWVSHIHGAHPIPGLAYGAEFGKPPAHLEHDPKRKVKPFHY